MSSKMEQIIEEIEDYIDGCKPSPISLMMLSSSACRVCVSFTEQERVSCARLSANIWKPFPECATLPTNIYSSAEQELRL